MSLGEWLGWVTLAVGVAGSVAVGLRGLSLQVARGIILLTQLQEKIQLCLVGIEALRIVDDSHQTELAEIEQRLDDVERYLQVASVVSDRPFVLRHGGPAPARPRPRPAPAP